MSPLKTYSWRGMGTEISLLFPSNEKISPYIIDAVKDIFYKAEKKFSRFQKDSLVSKINNEKKIEKDSEFFELYSLAQKIYQESKGAFNPLLSVKHIGYETSFQNPSKIKKATYDTDFEHIKVDETSILLQSKQDLDFGGIAKGWTVDKAGEFLQKESVNNFLINAGGDILAHGKAYSNEDWTIEIEESGQIISLQNQALATSGKNRRNWIGDDGKLYHHILDAHTKKSAENELESITVLADTCAEADAWATAAFSLGKIEGQNILIQNNIDYFLKF